MPVTSSVVFDWLHSLVSVGVGASELSELSELEEIGLSMMSAK